MHIFDFRNQLIDDYASYINSFIQIRDPQINQYVQQKLQEGVLWPEPLIQLNPLFAPGESIDELVAQDVLHPGCASIWSCPPIERHKDEKEYGEYRTKRVILEIYDEMGRAMETGVPYETRLAPPPVDATIAHGPRGSRETLAKQ